MGISIRAYARARGVSDTAVRKAIKTGRITPEHDGTIEDSRADREWQRNTDSSQQRGRQRAVPNEAIAAVRETVGEAPLPGGPGGGTTFLQARTANEVLKAQTQKLRLSRLKGELVDRAQAIAQVFTLARAERDAWLNWPARISAQMAAELGMDGHALHVILEREVRHHLEELGTFQPRVD
ncbi:MAG: elements of external origin [Candidatus Rokuibacteriota bacterium]